MLGLRSTVLLLCSLRLLAQDVRIDGTVLDAGTDIPVAGAKVVLRYITSPAALDTFTTGASGDFHLSVSQPGIYAIEADAPGFLETLYRGAGSGIEIRDTEFEPQSDAKPHRASLELRRSGIVSGHIQSADTLKPMGLVTVRALRYWWLRGKRQLTEAGVTFTDDDGLFRFASLKPGQYLVEISRSGDKTYPIVLWPGTGANSIDAMDVVSGADTDTGTISYSKMATTRVRGEVVSCLIPGNVQGEYALSVQQRVGGAVLNRDSIRARCGEPFSLPSISPGSYRLQFLGFRPAVSLLQSGPAIGVAELNVDVKEGDNLNVAVKLNDAARISGKVVCDCETERTTEETPLIVRLTPDESGPTDAAQGSVLDDGTFVVPASFFGRARLTLANLRPELYVKQISSGGTDSRIVDVIPGSVASVEITVSDKPSTITGSVIRDSKPAVRDRIVLAAWPLHSAPDVYPDYATAETDDNGNFTIKNVSSGNYRVVNVLPAEWMNKDLPDAIANWLASGKEITIAEKETRTIRLGGN